MAAGVANADDTPAQEHSRFAEVESAAYEAVDLNSSPNWKEVPGFLQGAVVFENLLPMHKKTNKAEFEVTAPGVVVLACSFDYDGEGNAEAYANRYSVERLENEGWAAIGTLNRVEKAKDGAEKLVKHVLYCKQIEQKDKFAIYSQMRNCPYLIVPRAESMAAMAAKIAGTDRGLTDPNSIVLRRRYTDWLKPGLDHSSLLQELTRQGLLIAARDGLGLTTYDIQLRQNPALTEGGINVPLNCRGQVDVVKNTYTAEIFRGNRPVWSVTLPLAGIDTVEEVTEVVEQLSRNEFLTVLKRLGFAGQQNPPLKQAEPPDDVVEMSPQMTFPAQFSALRRLHEYIRTDGESPERLSYLARSYATLGLLAGNVVGPQTAVLRARSLLYAQRLLQQAGNTPLALATRGYVLAATGRHHRALADLEAAEKASRGAELGIWARIAQAACLSDIETIEKLAADASWGAMARLFWLEQVNTADSKDLIRAAAEALLKSEPLNDRAYVAMGSNSFRSGAQEQFPEVLRALARRCAELTDAPPALKQIVGNLAEDEAAVRVQLMRALRQEADPRGEPSWSALAGLWEEVTFLQSWLEQYQYIRQLGVSGNDYGLRYLDALEDPNYRQYLRYAAASNPEFNKLGYAFAEMLRGDDLPSGPSILSDYAARMNHRPAHEVFQRYVQHQDPTLRNFARRYKIAINHFAVSPASLPEGYLDEFRRVCPNALAMIETILKHDKEHSLEYVPKAEKLAALVPELRLAIADVYITHQKNAQAIEVLKDHVRDYPTPEAYVKLAEIYDKRQDEPQYIATLEESLRRCERSLKSMRAAAMIAERYCSRRDWTAAKPYADMAAATGSGWGLMGAGVCAEAEQDWEAAEEYYAATAQRYDDARAEWYFFCKRTGQGDAASALRLARQLASESTPDDFAPSVPWVLYFQGQKTEAEVMWRDDKDQSLDGALTYVFVAHELDKKSERDATLAKMIAAPKANWGNNILAVPEFIELASLFQAAWGTGQPLNLDAIEVLRSRTELQTVHRMYIDGYVGRFLYLAGERDAAIKYLRRAVTAPLLSNVQRSHAAVMLLDLGVKPEDYKAEIQSLLPAVVPVQAKGDLRRLTPSEVLQLEPSAFATIQPLLKGRFSNLRRGAMPYDASLESMFVANPPSMLQGMQFYQSNEKNTEAAFKVESDGWVLLAISGTAPGIIGSPLPTLPVALAVDGWHWLAFWHDSYLIRQVCYRYCKAGEQLRLTAGSPPPLIITRLTEQQLRPPALVADADPERNLANWVLATAGGLEIETPTPRKRVTIETEDQLPQGSFVVRKVYLGGVHITDESLKILSPCTGIQVLSINGCDITNDGFKHLASLRSLNALNAAGTKVTGAALASLEGLRFLSHIRLDWTPFTDEDAAALKRLPAIQVLSLGHTKLGHDCLSQLQSLPKLRSLNLTGIDISQGLKMPAGMENLKQINLTAAHVRPGDLDTLRTTLPTIELLTGVWPKWTGVWTFKLDNKQRRVYAILPDGRVRWGNKLGRSQRGPRDESGFIVFTTGETARLRLDGDTMHLDDVVAGASPSQRPPSGTGTRLGDARQSDFDQREDFAPFAGTWNVAYTNNAERTYAVNAEGIVQFEGRQGALLHANDQILLSFSDDSKLERLQLSDGQLLIEHFNTASEYPRGVTCTGVGQKIPDEPTTK